jgi:hypothetical protein
VKSVKVLGDGLDLFLGGWGGDETDGNAVISKFSRQGAFRTLDEGKIGFLVECCDRNVGYLYVRA